MKALAIIFLAVLAAIVFGIVHDQITARVSIEYFTVAHPPMIGLGRSDSPTINGIYWGIVATWWVGLPLGIGLAVAARAGKRPKLSARQLFHPILFLLICMLGIAAIAGLVGYILAENGSIELNRWLARKIPSEQHSSFIAVGAAHFVSYLSGAIGGVVLWVWVWFRRKRLEPLAGPNALDST
ncbi:MAG: hypothetical protein AAGK14_10810 [Verrucomicrobiota bacterium]